MQILFSNHARHQLRERGLSPETIQNIVRTARNKSRRHDGTQIAQKRITWHSRRVLCRVIFRRLSVDTVLIITAYITTKFRKYK